MALSKTVEKDYRVLVKNVSDQRDKYNFIGLTLEVNGVTIYGAAYREGKNGAFISFPSHKGNDGAYYNHCYFPISKDCITSIEKQIEDLLN